LKAIRVPRIPRGLLLLAILVGPVIGLAVHRLAVRVENDRAQAQFEGRVATAAFAIDRELTADLEVLFALRSHFDHGPAVSRESFAAMARSILRRHPCLRALEWIPRVGLNKRQAHEERVRNEGFTGYTITEQVSTRELGPADERDWYFPVTFLEPFEGNEHALGFDLGSDQLRREAIDRAAASGEPTLSDPIDLVQATGLAKGVLALLAVSEDGFENTEAHKPSLSGFVLAVFDIAGLLQQARLGPGSPALSGIRIELVDDDVDGRNLLIHRSPLDSQQRPVGGVSAEQLIDIGGQRWRLVAQPTAAFLQPLRTRQPVLLGAIAAIAWALLVGLIAILGKRTGDRLERRHARLMNNILGNLSDGVIVADTAGKILMANRAAIAVLGRGEKHIPPSEWSEAIGLFVPGTEELFPPDELPLARAIRGEATDSVEVIVRNRHSPDGAHMSVSGAPMKDGKGSVLGGVVVFRDISKRKRAEERLQRLSSAVEQTADSVLITDHQGTIEYVNPAFEATTGYSSAEALGKNPNILKSGAQNPQFYRDLWATILRGEPFRGMTVNRKKDGGLYHAEQTITAIKDGDGQITHFVSVLKDMTERRKIQEQEIELQLASMVQKRLFPSAPPQLSGYDLAGAVIPAEATCGDYFDFIPMADGAMALVAADVSGHGLGPALVMAETRAYLRSLMQATGDLAAIAGGVNRFLVADLQENFFVTMLLAKLEPATGRISYVNSGHPSGYIFGTSGNVSAELAARCLPLGLFLDRWQCNAHEFIVGRGELVVLVTDGVLETESPDGEEFGTERLLEVVSRHRRSRAQEIVERVHRSVRDFGRDQIQMDDVTIVVCKRDPID
jgi:PAS domain S-box-containing protein